jgi:hypothetical protein
MLDNKKVNTTQNLDSKHNHSVKIKSVIEGLQPEFLGILENCDLNTLTICDYLISMRNEVSSISDNYKKLIIKVLAYLSKFHTNKKFKEMIRDDIFLFLGSLKKNEISDPLHCHISTYNVYLVIIIRFFKWLYYPDATPKERTKPSVVEKIPSLKRKEQSIYKPSDLWTQEKFNLSKCACADLNHCFDFFKTIQPLAYFFVNIQGFTVLRS